MKKLLQIQDLDKSFAGVHAIDRLSFNIFEGEILALIGPNGCGKSTCVNLISGVYIQDSGKIIFDNQCELYKQTIQERAKMGLGRTFQSPKPFTNLTVRDSVLTIALLYNKTWKEAERKTDEMLEFLDLASSASVPSGKLPIEKRKWLDMARVMVTEPKLLMLDECLAGLTPSEMDNSLSIVKRINERGITILFIEHVISAVMQLCDRIVVMNEGHLLTEGEPKNVMANPDVIRAYLGGDYEHA
ncbi:MAG: ABC transporter ATP-binding protein [Oscillibacter sp.]|nr:ABC transporter ATP-binding protein [Oscillibacter sp.]